MQLRAPADPLVPISFNRRDVGPQHVQIEILYSGVCHSDIHQVPNEWGGSIYPMVPGHEIDVEVIPIQQINEAYQRMIKSQVKYRFVIDMASLKE